jgi:hypothetical protein
VISTLLAFAVVAATPASAEAPSKRYGGTGDVSNFRVTLWRHPHTVSWMVHVEAPCQNTPGVEEGGQMGNGQLPDRRALPVSRSGRFEQHIRDWNTGRDTISFDLTGRFGRAGTAAGTFSITYFPPELGVNCSSGLVHWTAESG